MYQDRLEAGHALAEKLAPYREDNGIVLAVPRGGVPVAYVIAKEMNWPLDLLLTKKIGHPQNREYAIGAVSLTDSVVKEHEGVTKAYIEKETELIRRNLQAMRSKFMHGKPQQDLKDKTVVVVDDGVATGHTLVSTLPLLRKENPRRIIVAVPVSSESAFEMLTQLADLVICPLIPPFFTGVGAFYEEFEPVRDEEVSYYLDELAAVKLGK